MTYRVVGRRKRGGRGHTLGVGLDEPAAERMLRRLAARDPLKEWLYCKLPEGKAHEDPGAIRP